jgi:hypothetical protein
VNIRPLIDCASACLRVCLLMYGLTGNAFASEEEVAPSSGLPPHEQAKDAPAKATVESTRCGSLVIQHCGAGRRRPSMVIDPDLRRLNRVLYQWAQARAVDPDSNEIVITEENQRPVTPEEAIEQALGPQMPPSTLITREAGNGLRCTTMVRNNRTVCSGPGNLLPSEWNPMADWSF